MLIRRPVTHNIQDTSHRNFIEDLYKLINGRNISFGRNVNSGDQNIEGRMVEIANTGAANTQFTVNHNLGYVPSFYDVKYMSLATNIYDGGTAWTDTQIFLKSSTANVRIRIFIH